MSFQAVGPEEPKERSPKLVVQDRTWYRQFVMGVCGCDCGEIQTMLHIVNFCPLTKFDGGLLRLHEADEAAVDWLTTYGS